MGGGFGLYGYLPAILESSHSRVLLPENYRQKVESRPDIAVYSKKIEWLPTLEDALREAKFLAIAVPPFFQERVVKWALSFPGIEAIFLEKPLAPDPLTSVELLDSISAAKKRLRIGYTFLLTEWYQQLKADLSRPHSRLRISWLFTANHFQSNQGSWKRSHRLGGGVLRFYGVHLLATLASLGYETAVTKMLHGHSDDEPAIWEAVFFGRGLPPCDVVVSSMSEQTEFGIQLVKANEVPSFQFSATSPFGVPSIGSAPDGRVPVLMKLLQSLNADDEKYTDVYRATNNLWSRAESGQSVRR